VSRTDFLLLWACLAPVAVAADMLMLWYRLAGRAGGHARAESLAAIARIGGIRRSVLVTVVLDALLPPIALATCLVMYIRERRRPRGQGLPGDAPADSSQDALGRLLERMSMAFAAPWRTTLIQVAMYAVPAGAGTALRLLVPLPVPLAAGAGAGIVLAGMLLPAGPGHRAGPVPDWVPAAEAAGRELPAALGGVVRSLEDFAARTGRRGAFLCLFPCAAQKGPYARLRMSGAIHEEGGYLLAVLGEHMAPVAAVLLGHETAHTHGWRRRAGRTAQLARPAGWLLAGWAAGWPWALAAGAAVQAVTMLVLMTVEAACDLRSAREYGADAAIATVRHSRGQHQAPFRWEPALLMGLRHVTGLTIHPPDRVRCLILRLLAPPAGQAAAASTAPALRAAQPGTSPAQQETAVQ
jgi:hypothetical protein